ncbi:methionyl-tRNA formyltransferase [Rickettsia canadensis str. CA410]|uniref:Methionyl-tRNA formyltransferase n=1 Tax=Rickettsia canadensis str. CA410 TaxID=1105107 RepID=A0ABM5MTH1_RICCA|nr:cell division protein ZapE [Rickettsia canadensis]AFB20805.1 methionyl-tRNA formyltransferase [Rickettsia canadensis str. CA410]
MTIPLDVKQIALSKELTEIALELNKPRTLLQIFSKNNLKSGIYLYGPVGSGKTMLMNSFFEELTASKIIIHYQNFMQEIHKMMHKLQTENQKDIILKIAKDYAKNTRVLCIDEFEIKDITDAMIIGRLFDKLIKQNIFIFITSNTSPNNLYKNGLQRESFLPFIKIINNTFYVKYLDNHHDYRFDKALGVKGERIIYPLTLENQKKLEKIITDISDNRVLSKLTYREEFIGDMEYSTTTIPVHEDTSTELTYKLPLEGEYAKNSTNFTPQNIEVLGRKISFQKVHKRILVTDYNELFTRDLSYIDYINICQNFNVIIVQNVHTIDANDTNTVVRFINFIDNAYFYKILLFMSLEDDPNKIYQGSNRSEEFKRTISRLNEMNSAAYLLNNNLRN